MRIDTLTRHDALALMGSEASEAEADAMLELLRACGRADTDEIPDGEWRVIMDHAIARAGGRDILTVETHYDGVDYQAEIDGDRVTISRRGRQSPTWAWCGEGTIRDGVIADCPADLPGAAYEALAEMIVGGPSGQVRGLQV